MLERIDFSDCSFDLFVELMRSNALQNAVVVISEDDVSLRVELKNQVVRKGLGAEGNHDHSFDADLPDAFHSFGA